MRVTVRLFARLRDLAGTGELTRDVSAPATVQTVWNSLVAEMPSLVEYERTMWADTRLGVHHRIGRLEIGEASIIIVAASPHRAHAFAACRYTIERVKQIVPIWKHEHFEGGEVWLEGATADPEDENAKQAAYRIACA